MSRQIKSSLNLKYERGSFKKISISTKRASKTSNLLALILGSFNFKKEFVFINKPSIREKIKLKEEMKNFKIYNKTIGNYSFFPITLLNSSNPYTADKLSKFLNEELIIDYVSEQTFSLVNLKESANKIKSGSLKLYKSEETLRLKSPLISIDLSEREGFLINLLKSFTARFLSLEIRELEREDVALELLSFGIKNDYNFSSLLDFKIREREGITSELTARIFDHLKENAGEFLKAKEAFILLNINLEINGKTFKSQNFYSSSLKQERGLLSFSSYSKYKFLSDKILKRLFIQKSNLYVALKELFSNLESNYIELDESLKEIEIESTLFKETKLKDLLKKLKENWGITYFENNNKLVIGYDLPFREFKLYDQIILKRETGELAGEILNSITNENLVSLTKDDALVRGFKMLYFKDVKGEEVKEKVLMKGRYTLRLRVEGAVQKRGLKAYLKDVILDFEYQHRYKYMEKNLIVEERDNALILTLEIQLEYTGQFTAYALIVEEYEKRKSLLKSEEFFLKAGEQKSLRINANQNQIFDEFKEEKKFIKSTLTLNEGFIDIDLLAQKDDKYKIEILGKEFEEREESRQIYFSEQSKNHYGLFEKSYKNLTERRARELLALKSEGANWIKIKTLGQMEIKLGDIVEFSCDDGLMLGEVIEINTELKNTAFTSTLLLNSLKGEGEGVAIGNFKIGGVIGGFYEIL